MWTPRILLDEERVRQQHQLRSSTFFGLHQCINESHVQTPMSLPVQTVKCHFEVFLDYTDGLQSKEKFSDSSIVVGEPAVSGESRRLR